MRGLTRASPTHLVGCNMVCYCPRGYYLYQRRTSYLIKYQRCWQTWQLAMKQKFLKQEYWSTSASHGTIPAKCTLQILGGGGWQGLRTSHVPPSLPPPLIFKPKFKIFVTLSFKVSVTLLPPPLPRKRAKSILLCFDQL